MGTPVTASSTPLVFETLPAVKVCHYSFSGSLNNLYTYARFYVYNEALVIGVYGFKEIPDPQDRISLMIGKSGNYLFLSVSSTQATVLLANEAATVQHPMGTSLDAPPFIPFSGVDEQGWFWGAETTLSAAQLKQAGLVLRPGFDFEAAVFYHRINEEGFGASFPYNPSVSLIYQQYPVFTVVSY